ncbi:hypothetical protein [Ruminococcus gauvreauii]|uniref:hypothetical protein n=1 Tax=Ruminococcus gauvreauii TaxID=438033 RepID=UPI0039840877
MNKQRILLMYANTYEMDNGNNGLTLNYFFWGENGELLRTTNDLSGGPVGYQRAKNSVEKELRSKITFAPAIYDAEFVMSVGGDGKPVLKVCDLEYVGQVEIKPADRPAAGK